MEEKFLVRAMVRVVQGNCAQMLCAGVCAQGCACLCAQRTLGWLCAGVVCKVVRNGVHSLCARRMPSLVRIERHKGFALFSSALFELHKGLSLVRILFH